MAAGWQIQAITHCSASLLCSNSLAVHSSPAAAVGEADVTTAATIVKQAAKPLAAATVTTGATVAATKLTPPVTVGREAQGIGELVAAVGGGVGI